MAQTTINKNQVIKFYQLLWNAHDLSSMPEILHREFTFRGSLGDEKKGHDGFTDYVNRVHSALDDYYCLIEELVAEKNKVVAKMLFSGIHNNEFLGYAPTRKKVSWHGCALFTFKASLITDVWVLGDLKNLEHQLKSI